MKAEFKAEFKTAFKTRLTTAWVRNTYRALTDILPGCPECVDLAPGNHHSSCDMIYTGRRWVKLGPK